MRTIQIVQCYDGFQSDKGWVPVMSCSSREEADQWVKDEKKKNDKYDVRGLHYRVSPCKFVKR